jgi:D-serine deaminase-like pyridoxal phosphate-dependent protein
LNTGINELLALVCVLLNTGINELLESRNSTLEAAKARIAELESVVTRRDMVIADQKRCLKQVKEEYQKDLEVCNLCTMCNNVSDHKMTITTSPFE